MPWWRSFFFTLFLLVLSTRWSSSDEKSRESSSVGREECERLYGARDFIDAAKMWDRGMPYLLLSFPGSGNTWVRLLIEYATGLHSSTIYGGGGPYGKDKELREVFKGEEKCGLRTIIIKAHPEDLVLERGAGKDPVAGQIKLRSPNKHVRRKCGRSLIHYFDKVIFLTRDPYRAILSDYQRMVTTSHTGESSSLQQLQQQRQEQQHHRQQGPKLTAQQFWLDLALTKALSFRDKMDSVVLPLLHPAVSLPAPLLPYAHSEGSVAMGVVRYEDLLDKKKRMATLSNLIKMLNVSTFTDTKRMACAFTLANDPRIRRGYNSSSASSKSVGSDGGIRLVSNSSSSSSASSLAYNYRGIQANFTEVLWEHLRGFAGNFNYPKPSFT